MVKKILIIDDNDQDQKIMNRYLKEEGFEDVLFAHNGGEGIEKARSEKPDLIVIDTLLPEMDGFEVCRKIREEDGISQVKIIIITGFIDAVDAVKARSVGADDYCVKTSDFSSLIEAVKSIV